MPGGNVLPFQEDIYCYTSRRRKSIRDSLNSSSSGGSKSKAIMISMTIAANFVLFYSLHLLNARFCAAFPFLVPKVEMEEVKAMVDTETDDYFRLQSMDSGLQDLVNSSANKQIFNQLKFSEDAYYDKKLNTLGTMKFTNHNQYQRQPYVANGYIGSRIPNLGQGFAYDSLPDFEASGDANDLYNGWPLFTRRFAGAFIAGFYDLQENTTGTNFPELLENGYESVIAAVPQWTTLKVQMYRDGKKYTLDSSLGHSDVGNISNYMQNLSLSSGIVTTQYTWLDEIDIKFTVLAHKSELSLGLVTLDVHNRANKTVLLTIIDEIDFNTAKRCELNVVGYDSTGIHMTFQPKNVDYVHGAIYSSLLIGDGNIERQSTDRVVNQTAKLQVGANDNVQLRKVVGIISSDLDPETLSTASDVREAAKQIVQKNKDDPRMLIKSHIDAWAETLGTSERISFPSEPLLDLGAKASMFHLLANTRSNAQGLTGAVGVSGLSSDSYGGMVFWDTDLWMFNGILPFVPSHAKSIVNYRLHTHEQALKNVPKGYGGAVYPWTSGRFGNCTATGPCLDYEYHINSAIAMAAWELYLSGAVDDDYLRNVAFPLINDAATFYTEYLVKYNDTFNKFTTHNLTDPDEYANHVDNGAYTNSGISLVMQWAIAVANHLGEQVPQIFYQIASDIYIPTADNSQNITLEYSGMNSSVGIKQADVVMMTYPLENNLIDDEQGYLNMEFYSMKQVSYGPAMTYPIFSVVAAKLAATGCASQSYLHKALQPYLRGPFAQFSEQNNDDYNINGGTHPAFPFLTGHGGFLQAALLGLTGMRHKFTIDKDNKISRILHLDPIALPCLGEGVRYDSIHYDNHTISMNINQTHFTIKNNGKTFPKARDYIQLALSERNPAHGSYQLKDEEERAFPLTVLKKSFVDSISECGDATFYNITEGAFGVAAISMNDGDNTTRWQAKSNDMTGKVMVDLHSIKNVSAVEFNWADRPPQFLKISKYTGSKFTNITDFLAKVDFGNRVYENYRFANPEDKLYNQSEIFEVVHSEIVNISEPYSEDEIREIMVPLRHNTTSLDLNIDSQFILIEVKGIHDDIPHDEEVGGAKLAEVVFY